MMKCMITMRYAACLLFLLELISRNSDINSILSYQILANNKGIVKIRI